MESIRTVFFDFDGVLTTDKNGSTTTIDALSSIFGLEDAVARSAYSPHIGDLVLGRKSHTNILSSLSDAIGQPVSHEHLLRAFASTPMNAPMIHLARTIAERCRVGIITDNPSDRMHCLSELHKLDSLFDPIVVSADIGSSKYTPEIFVHGLHLAGSASEQTIFIDNTARNLETATALGIHVIHHDDNVNDIGKLRSTLSDLYGLFG